MARTPRLPAYTLHKPSGQARVYIDGKSIYLGEYGSEKSRIAYGEIIARHAAGLPIDPLAKGKQSNGSDADTGPTIAELLLGYWHHANEYYRGPDGKPTTEINCLRSALKPLRQLFEFTPADEFTPLMLKTVRQKYIEAGWTRLNINKCVSRVRSVFRWGVENGLVSVNTWTALKALSPLSAGRSAAVEGRKRSAVSAVIVDELPPIKRRTLCGTWRNIPSAESVVLLADATATKDDIEAYGCSQVTVITPDGHVARSKRVVQRPSDITRRTKPSVTRAIVRGIMAQFPNARRVGIITHRPQIAGLNTIGGTFRERIVKITHFGSGEDRASNEWYGLCELIIVLGTPRVAPLAVQKRLIQFGDFGAAGENSDWGDVRWRGHTELGREIIVLNRGYRQPQWLRAHRSLVRAALIQAAGRGRPLLDAGCDVVIVSTEECGFPLDDKPGIQISDADVFVLSVMSNDIGTKVDTTNLTEPCALKYSKRTVPINSEGSTFVPMCTTAEIAAQLGFCERRARKILTGLESNRLVSRVGDRSGWAITEAGLSLVSKRD